MRLRPQSSNPSPYSSPQTLNLLHTELGKPELLISFDTGVRVLGRWPPKPAEANPTPPGIGARFLGTRIGSTLYCRDVRTLRGSYLEFPLLHSTRTERLGTWISAIPISTEKSIIENSPCQSPALGRRPVFRIEGFRV